MKKILKFQSIGKKHENEFDFFKFLVKQEFSYEESRAINWCNFKELNIEVECLEPEILKFVLDVVGNGIETNTGYKFILVN